MIEDDLRGLLAEDMDVDVYARLIPLGMPECVMVQEIGGDEQLANQLVMWTTVLSMLSVFLFAFVLKSSGLL